MKILLRKPFIPMVLIELLFTVALLDACTGTISPQNSNIQPQPTILKNPTLPATESTSSTQAPVYSPSPAEPITDNAEQMPAVTLSDAASEIIYATPPQLSPDDWMTLPVIPSVSQNAKSIYQRGLAMGNDPRAFSKVGDCQSIPTYFLNYFDMPGYYDLGSFSSLQQTIDWYEGSFSRESLAVKGGFNAAAILSPLRADPQQCKPDENPIECEFRFHHPSVVIISLEEWWAGHPENYESYMRQILDYAIEHGVLPIIATKADNLEGNNLINQTIAKLANEYDIPLWNFWLAVQTLPNHGLIAYNSSGEADMFHLTHSEGYYFYNNPANMQSGWSIRNLTALQALDAVRQALNENP
jgi:hypothetical protein